MVAQLVKNSPANVRDTRDVGSIPGSGKSPGVGNGNSLQYSCLENFVGRGVWWATKSWIQTERLSTAQYYENRKNFSVDNYYFRSSDLKLLWCVQKLRHMQSCRHRSELSGASCEELGIHQRNEKLHVLLLNKVKDTRMYQE